MIAMQRFSKLQLKLTFDEAEGPRPRWAHPKLVIQGYAPEPLQMKLASADLHLI